MIKKTAENCYDAEKHIASVKLWEQTDSYIDKVIAAKHIASVKLWEQTDSYIDEVIAAKHIASVKL